jgi:hypothetical protein
MPLLPAPLPLALLPLLPAPTLPVICRVCCIQPLKLLLLALILGEGSRCSYRDRPAHQ